ncbi:hypothetical protein [Flavobacterium sp. 2]|uniref:hypothetical protein n=1 Tax=Flavobacterium sp. 2 TaxID=308053 RepID=UPI003CEDD031
MKIHSKFRTLFLIRINFVYVIVDFICLSYFFGSFRTENYKETFGSLLFLALSLFFHINLIRSVYEITVTQKGIKRKTLASNKEDFIPYTSILKVETVRIQGSYTKAGQITTGYFESTVFLKDGTELLISPDHFENYREIIVAIRSKVMN